MPIIVKHMKMFGIVIISLITLLFILAPHAAFLIFGGVLVSLILLGVVGRIKMKIPAPKRKLLVLTIIGIFLLTAGLVWLVSSRLANEMQTFSEMLPTAIDNLVQKLKQYEWINKAWEQAQRDNWMEDFLIPKILPKTAKVAAITLNAVVAFGIAMFLGVYFAIDSKKFGEIMRKLAPKKQEGKYQHLFTVLFKNLQSWLMGQLMSMFAIFLLAYIGLLALGIKAALPLAFIAGFLTFIPNIGPIIASLVAMTLAFPEGLEMVLYVAILYMAIEALEGMLITPLIQKRKVKLLPAALISFQFIMAILFGFPGLFFATPFMVALMTVIDQFWIKSAPASKVIEQEV